MRLANSERSSFSGAPSYLEMFCKLVGLDAVRLTTRILPPEEDLVDRYPAIKGIMNRLPHDIRISQSPVLRCAVNSDLDTTHVKCGDHSKPCSLLEDRIVDAEPWLPTHILEVACSLRTF